MLEEILKYLEYAGSAISLFAVAVIVVGFALGGGAYFWLVQSLPAVQ